MTFKQFFYESITREKTKRRKHRHLPGLMGRPDTIGRFRQKHPGAVPEYVKEKPGRVHKVDILKDKRAGKIVLSPSEVLKVKKLYKIARYIKPNDPKKLGNTGISLIYDPQKHKYFIQK